MSQPPMYCYNCGAHIAPEQNFCRACGANLRAVLESSSGYSPRWSAPPNRLQILVETVTDALRSGIQYISQSPTANLGQNDRAARFGRWGFIAFWAGLAALWGPHIGVALIIVGIVLMAYARGFFGPVKESPPTRADDFQAPPSRETSYASDQTRPSAVGEERGWRTEDRQ